jgi:host factor-I protein
MLKEHTVRHPSNPEMSEDEFLQTLVDGRVPVAIYLKNGIRLQGEIEAYESYGLLLRGISHQFIYKHAISTILPSRDVSGSAPPGEGDALIARRATTLRPRKSQLP